jgi:hypothetical protein
MLIKEEMLIQENEYHYLLFELMDIILVNPYDDVLNNVLIVNMQLNNEVYYLMQNINAIYNVEVHNHQLMLRLKEEN